MEDYKWTRGLSKSTISNVLECGPKSVKFTIQRRIGTTVCTIERDLDSARGIALCSCLDEFDESRGKNIAARRAVLALTEGKSSRSVRQDWYLFPNTWTKKRIDHLQGFNGMYKCQYTDDKGHRVIGEVDGHLA